ncbi:sensor histidine kinase [Mycobacterium sp. pV006]|uniref:sensor histidine kinase n=1 Tax=Mycobacterium sp. pV006 TaxID=3238983 RepID=UPI00351B8E7F
MGSGKLKLLAPPGSVPDWRIPKVLLTSAFRSSAWFGHNLIHRFRSERFEVFLSGHFGLWLAAGIVLPLWEYLFVFRSPWMLGFVAVAGVQCVVLAIALNLARHNMFEQSVTLVCIGNWVAVLGVTFVSPPLLPVMALLALVPVVFAEPYISLRRGLIFTVVTAVCVLAAAAIAEFTPFTAHVEQAPPWMATAFVLIALPLNALHLMVIVWNNAAALRISEAQLADHAAELAASRTRLITAADEERRRLERDLHDGAQQHLVALSVLIGLARNTDGDKRAELLAEASTLVDSAITEIRNLAHGIYPPLLVSGGLAQALPALAARSVVPVHLDLDAVGRFPPTTEAALYYCCSEALQNATKHGGPDTTVHIIARLDSGTLTLTIADTGRGFRPGTVGAGLTNMTDRLSAVGGHLVVDSAPGRGTRVTATVPT